MSRDPRLREGLLGLEPLDHEMRQRFERQIQDIVDGKLTRGARVYWGFFLTACVIQAAFFGYNLVVAPLRGSLLWAIALCFAASVACGVFVGYVLVRGRVNLRVQLAGGKFLPAVGLLIVFVSFLYGMEDWTRPGATFFGIYALAAFAVGSSINLWNRIVAADLHTQEHLLRLEYRLADLATRLTAGAPASRPPAGTDQLG